MSEHAETVRVYLGSTRSPQYTVGSRYVSREQALNALDALVARVAELEAERDALRRELDAVDAYVRPWESDPASDVGCVGRVQTILNLKADRAETAALRNHVANLHELLREWMDMGYLSPFAPGEEDG